MDVLHPPARGPEGNENARSLVLLLHYASHSILLTGDLEGNGLARVLDLPPPTVEVMMSPHHGSRTANTPALAQWAKPRVVVACMGQLRGRVSGGQVYTSAGIKFLGTWPHGAITMRFHATGLVVETFQSKQTMVVRKTRRPASDGELPPEVQAEP